MSIGHAATTARVCVFVIRSESQLRKIAVFVAAQVARCEFQREISEADTLIGVKPKQEEEPHCSGSESEQ